MHGTIIKAGPAPMSNAMRILFFLIIAAGLLQCADARADRGCDDELFISMDAWSKHHISGEFNEHHEAIGLQCDSWSLLYFKNSYYKAGRVGSKARHDERSLGLGWHYKWREFGPVRVDGYLAAWTGYYDQGVTGEGIIPVAAPRISTSIGGLEFALLPTPYVTVLQVGWRFR